MGRPGGELREPPTQLVRRLDEVFAQRRCSPNIYGCGKSHLRIMREALSKEAAGLDFHCRKNSLAPVMVGVEARDC